MLIEFQLTPLKSADGFQAYAPDQIKAVHECPDKLVRVDILGDRFATLVYNNLSDIKQQFDGLGKTLVALKTHKGGTLHVNSEAVKSIAYSASNNDSTTVIVWRDNSISSVNQPYREVAGLFGVRQTAKNTAA